MLKHIILMLTACASVVLAQTNLISNFDFSQFAGDQPAGWKPLPSNFRIDINGGLNGNCLAFENKDPKLYQMATQTIPCQPGDRFDFGVYVKTEGITGNDSGATICLEFTDDDGKYRGGLYPSGKKGTTPDWTLISESGAEVPENVHQMTIVLYVRQGMVGKAWFDRPYCRPYHPDLVGSIAVNSYRNMVMGKQADVFVSINLKDLKIAPENVSGHFDIINQDGKVLRTFKPAAITTVSATAVMDVTTIPAGTYTLKATFKTNDGKENGSAQTIFKKLSKPLDARCYIDEYQRLIVDGKPFFPLGVYMSSAAEKDLKVIADSPFNCIMPYNSPSTVEGMDAVHNHGLKIIYSVKDVYPGTTWCPKEVKNDEDAEAYIGKKVSLFKDHPALIAWYINDELPRSMVPKLAARRDLMESLDPDHPSWVVLYQYHQIADYMSTFDVIGTDPYPIPGKGAYEAARWTRSTRKGSFNFRAVWQVPQIFNWACYRKGDDAKGCRMPTTEEIRAMFWLCIANGANGLIPYSYFDLRKPSNGVPFEQAWAEVCSVAAQVKQYTPILLSVEPAVAVTNVSYKQVDTRTWHADDNDYLLVVNGNEDATEVTITLDSNEFKAAQAEFGPTPKLKGNKITLKMQALETAFIKLTR